MASIIRLLSLHPTLKRWALEFLTFLLQVNEDTEQKELRSHHDNLLEIKQRYEEKLALIRFQETKHEVWEHGQIMEKISKRRALLLKQIERMSEK